MKRGWVEPEKVKELAMPMIKNDYGKYLYKRAEETIAKRKDNN